MIGENNEDAYNIMIDKYQPVIDKFAKKYIDSYPGIKLDKDENSLFETERLAADDGDGHDGIDRMPQHQGGGAGACGTGAGEEGGEHHQRDGFDVWRAHNGLCVEGSGD